ARRGLREIMRFGHFKVLNAAIGKYKINPAEISELRTMVLVPTGAPNPKSVIEIAQHRGRELHSKLVRGSGEDSLYDEYAQCLATIDQHKQLANKVYLNHHVRLHRLMMRVVARLVDFAGLWERDGYFITLALMKLHTMTPDMVFPLDASSNKAQSRAEKDFRKDGKLPRTDAEFEPGFLAKLMPYHSRDQRHIRDDIAHFNILANEDVDLTRAINDTRKLMRYDRKLKNAVSKSIREMLDEEGLAISWTMDNHQLKFSTLTSKDIKHLKDYIQDKKMPEEKKNKFNIPFHSPGYLDMVKQLFVVNSPSETK
ncbi:MAG: hypothetical protein GY761_07735, partial [Hyphomicrobiales bacterium]|nr:hypothetical protein [Hyphomicrobiales bacterium]